MKKRVRTSVGRWRVGLAIAMVSLATLLFAYHPTLDAQQTDATDAPPLVVFAVNEPRANQPSLSAAAEVTLETIHSDPAASDVRIGRSAPAAIAAALDARVLSFALPSASDAGEAVITFTGVDVQHNDEGMVSLYARDEATDSEVALVIQGPDVLGSVRHGQDVYKAHPLGDGVTAVYHYDTSQLRRHPPNWGHIMQNNLLLQMHAPDRDGAGTPGAADTGDVIDLLVAYTRSARAEAGNIDMFIQFAIDNTHRIYSNSNIGFRLRLVHKYQTSYTQNRSDMQSDLRRLTVTAGTVISGQPWDPNGDMDEVHGLRDRYGADLVALIVARDSDACGIAWIPDFGRYPSQDFETFGFSVTAWNCETATHHTFAHELGHNQGAHHDPDNTCRSPPCTLPSLPTYPYRQGRCNTVEGWNTTMSYNSNRQGDCRREIEYFSSPILNYRGTLTGDRARRDNRRVLLQTARRVANYRQSVSPPTTAGSNSLPFLTPASNSTQQGLVRVINRSATSGTVRIHAIDDAGRRFGPVSLALGRRQTRHFTSAHLERGGGGLLSGLGNGTGNWRLEFDTSLDIEPLAYIRVADGFVAGVHEVAEGTVQGSRHVYDVPFVFPGSNRSQVSTLRLINPGSVNAGISVTGFDDRGRAAPRGEVRLTLRAGAARMVTAQQLELGTGLSGRLGDGAGYWRLSVSADSPIQVMSLLHNSPSGHLVNLSRGRAEPSEGPPPPPQAPDLVVQNPSVTNASPSAGQSFTLRATVRNRGNLRSAATTLRYYRSSDATISTQDTQVGTDPVRGLAAADTSPEAIGLRAPSLLGTYYYGACVMPVSGESNTRNNCSSAVRVMVTSVTAPDLVVLSPSVSDSSLSTGQSFTLRATVRNRGNASSAATTLRYYRSSDATISTRDTQVGTDPVRSLAGSASSPESIGLRAPSSAGTYYYGACVVPVFRESNTGNNCSGAVRVTVGVLGPRFGAAAVAFSVSPSCPGLAAGIATNHGTEQEALDAAILLCRNDGGSAPNCEAGTITFQTCAAMSYGENPAGCGLRFVTGLTRSAAESAALGECRSDAFSGCRIWVNRSGQRMSGCSSQSNSGGRAAMEASRPLLELNKP